MQKLKKKQKIRRAAGEAQAIKEVADAKALEIQKFMMQ